MTDRLADRGAMSAHFDGQGALIERDQTTPAEREAREIARQWYDDEFADSLKCVIRWLDEGRSRDAIREACRIIVEDDWEDEGSGLIDPAEADALMERWFDLWRRDVATRAENAAPRPLNDSAPGANLYNGHASGCAVHNAPAMSAGGCDCGLLAGTRVAASWGADLADAAQAENAKPTPLSESMIWRYMGANKASGDVVINGSLTAARAPAKLPAVDAELWRGLLSDYA